MGGKTVFVERMATWCTSCRRLMTILREVVAEGSELRAQPSDCRGDGRLVLETEEMILARLHDLVGAAPEGGLVSEELLRERREEAEREAREMDLL